ncbi:hypothetical protein AAFF_G00386020 [Aldrovandia affinis]|uniref:Uncharacterized protein n=1 Tax=Aldrovandia affinis TaxID=143900 RepID=A0AAD7SF19_9TELE|nr:hypothetical protein AAFF_G00386020 [Aldrovandia affinis]
MLLRNRIEGAYWKQLLKIRGTDQIPRNTSTGTVHSSGPACNDNKNNNCCLCRLEGLTSSRSGNDISFGLTEAETNRHTDLWPRHCPYGTVGRGFGPSLRRARSLRADRGGTCRE